MFSLVIVSAGNIGKILEGIIKELAFLEFFLNWGMMENEPG